MSTARYNSVTFTLDNGQLVELQVDQNGRLKIAGATAGSQADPSYIRTVGASTIATSQATSSVSPAAALQVVASRASRASVTLTNITGTQPVYLISSNATTGVTTGFYLAAAAGASVTISTTAAIFATSPTAAQTIGVLETYT